MPATKENDSINLLPQKQFAYTTTGRILGWILSTFRIIVIFTELVVMVAFLSRFWLDAQNSDLDEEIQQKTAILKASQEFETRFRSVQKKLVFVSAVAKHNDILYQLMDTLSTSTPPDITLISITNNSNTVNIEGLTANEKSIQQLIVNLASKDSFEDVSLASLTPSQTDISLMQFQIGANLVDKK